VPLYMDIHTFDDGVAAADVATAHLADLHTQGKHETQYLRYWVDEQRGKVFCLVRAPSVAAAESVHYEAHGLVADEIYQVQEGAGLGNGSAILAKRQGEEMSYPYIHTALARERQDMLLAEAQAVRLARQARAHRRNDGTPTGHRSPFRRTSAWLLATWSRLLNLRPGRREATS
jgi:hypothetical protein